MYCFMIYFFKQKKPSVHLPQEEQSQELHQGSKKEDYWGISFPHPRTATGIVVTKSCSF